MRRLIPRLQQLSDCYKILLTDTTKPCASKLGWNAIITRCCVYRGQSAKNSQFRLTSYVVFFSLPIAETMIAHATTMDDVRSLSIPIACAQYLLLAFHGGNVRLTHNSYPCRTLISPIWRGYPEVWKFENHILVSIVNRLHEHSVCIELFSRLLENEELKD